MIKPVYYHCTKWEDWKNGMFRTINNQGDDLLLSQSIELLKNEYFLLLAMQRVVNEWPVSTEENLTKLDTNRRAWLGWAACSITHKAPDIITRKAWGMLLENERNRANLIAEKVILEWEIEYLKISGEQNCLQLSLWE